MKIFISWSGDKSYAVAEALRDWLPKVIQAVKPFLSAKDIDKGAQWREVISKNLDEACTGIICLTRDNLTAPWLLFEAGALSKSVENYNTYVCTYLVDITPIDVREPLTQFQHTAAEKEDTKKLIKTLNRAIKKSGGEGSLDETLIDDIFEVWWPRLESELDKISKNFPAGGTPQPEREGRDILEEILSLVRTLSKEQPLYTYSPALTAGPSQVYGEVQEGSGVIFLPGLTPAGLTPGAYVWPGAPSSSKIVIPGERLYGKKKEEPPHGEEE